MKENIMYALWENKNLVNIYITKKLAEEWMNYYQQRYKGNYEITTIMPVSTKPNK